MNVAMISVGNELLDGRTVEGNSSVAARILGELGVSLIEVRTVRDVIAEIAAALDNLNAELIIVSGGLGPTIDDVTRDGVAQWAGVDLNTDDDVLIEIKTRYESRGRTFSKNNARQARFPAGSHVIDNPHGTAPAFSVHAHGKTVISLPGVPREFQALAEQNLPELIDVHELPIVKSWQFQGLGESALETKLDGLSAFDVKVGYRARFPTIELKLIASDRDAMASAEAFVFENAGHWFVCEGDDTLASKVGHLLKDRGWTITTAESCTAGGIAAALTDIGGSSWWFERGFVTYSNQAKQDLVGVRENTLERYGAVSPQVAAQMARGAKEAAGAELSLSVSGIAGPAGGSEEKPVGTVHFGLGTPDGTFHLLIPFRIEGRDRIRQATVASSLALALWYLEGTLGERTGVTGPYADDEVDRDIGIEVSS